MPKFLTQKQINNFEKDGFVSPLNILSVEECLQIKDELEDAEKTWPEAFEGTARNNPHLVFKFLDEIVHNKRLLDAVEDLIGISILAYHTVLFIKEPKDEGFVSWHQDGKYMGLSEDVGVTSWMALTESNALSGCMSMIPGSHKYMHEHIDTYGKNNILTRGQKIDAVDETKAVLTPLRPGQCSLHCPTVIHGSQPNKSDYRRIGFAIQTYMRTDIKQTLGRTSAQLVRGTDEHNNFDLLERPSINMETSQIKIRNKVNHEWGDILYNGAVEKRNY
ncbi:MAG: phytanoyl-CoA dioxygenase family protein [Paracoccaceae bacterium]|nr:phytanoyl-CoA dioxygenase family protein [Paracoccaceae bacterium]